MIDAHAPRRTVLVGAGIGAAATALAACSTGDQTPEAAPQSSTPEGAPAVLTTTAAVPVGSAVIAGDVIVTQATAGDFKGFSSVCTHSGCTISKVLTAAVMCPCHGSQFALDGSVMKGPATKPLEPKAITVQGDSIVAG